MKPKNFLFSLFIFSVGFLTFFVAPVSIGNIVQLQGNARAQLLLKLQQQQNSAGGVNFNNSSNCDGTVVYVDENGKVTPVFKHGEVPGRVIPGGHGSP